MRTDDKPFLTALGVIVVSVVLALAGAMVLQSQGCRKNSVPLKSPVQVREDDIRNLEKLLQEDIADARKAGRTDADVKEMREKYQAEIDRLKAEIETLKAGGQLDTP